MNRWLQRAAVPALALMCSVALAQAPKAADASKGAPAAGSQEAQVAARFDERSGMKADQVFRGPGGLFEVLVRGEIYYVDPTVNFVIMGRMFDTRTREDLTQKRLDAALKVDFKSLPFDRAIKTVRGNGSRVLVTFEDPNCPYCKKLWQNMQGLNNVTIYTFLLPDPVAGLAGKVEGDLVLEGSRHDMGRLHGAGQGTVRRGGGLQDTARAEPRAGP